MAPALAAAAALQAAGNGELAEMPPGLVRSAARAPEFVVSTGVAGCEQAGDQAHEEHGGHPWWGNGWPRYASNQDLISPD